MSSSPGNKTKRFNLKAKGYFASHQNEMASQQQQDQQSKERNDDSGSQQHPAFRSSPMDMSIPSASSLSKNGRSGTTLTFASTVNRRRSATCPSSLGARSSKLKSTHKHSPSPPPSPRNRKRLNSREISRTYSGLFGIGGGEELTHSHQTPASDLLPFELSRNYNTNWLFSYPTADLHHNNTNHLRNNIMSSSLLWIYIFFILFVEFALVVLPLPFIQSHVEVSFTITNIIHGIITLIFLHWLKGSPDFYDHGELNAMTLWEQLSCCPESNIVANQTKQVLYIIPTLLCYVSCKFVNFDAGISLLNLGVWFICVVAKMDGMQGVRLFGFNRTIGIDDDLRKSN